MAPEPSQRLLNKLFSVAFRILIAAALISFLVAAIFLSIDYFKTKFAFPANTFIVKLDVSYLNRDQAIAKVRSTPIESFMPNVILQNSGETFTFAPQELGIFVLPEETVDKAFALTHTESYIKTFKNRIQGEPILLPAKFSFLDNMAKEILADLSQKVDSPAKDAGFIFIEETGGYHITPDHPARKLKLEESFAAAKQALNEGKNVLPLIFDYYSSPRITEKELAAAPPTSRLSAFTTYYGSHDSPNRIHNIKLIASWIDNTLMLSGEVFSLTDKIGDFSEERGFKEAFVILNNELVPQLGGGTCQIGTTLFNAASLADMEILSRRNHSFYFNIYPLGRDATVYPGQVDFKFKNNSGHPILIKAIATNKKLSFRFYGTSTGKTVDFSYPAIFTLDEDGIFRGSNLKEVMANDRPFRTSVVRTVKDSSGKIIKEENIRSSYKLYGAKSNVPIKRVEPR